MQFAAHAAHYRHFFDQLQNPEWIVPLQKHGFFKSPPSIVKDEARGSIQLPPWPESRYLARMAPHSPLLIRDIVKEIPSNGNSLVYTDLAEAALAMPPDTAATLIDQAMQWSKAIDRLTLLPQKLTALAVHLAIGGKIKEALKLANELLTLSPDPRGEQIGNDPEFSLPPEPQTPFDPWTYEQILKSEVPELVKAAGLDAFELLCDLLSQSIALSQRDRAGEGPEDYSYIWRPAIEDSDRFSELKSLLVSAVRDAAEQIAAKDERLLPKLIEKLSSRRPPWRVFSRIALHLLVRLPDAANSKAIATELLLNRDLFGDRDCQHEYILALRSYFPRLDPEPQKEIVQLVSTPPPKEHFKSNWRNWVQAHENWPWEREMTDERAEQEQRRWMFERMNWLGTSLPDSLKTIREELAKEFPETGEVERPIAFKEIIGPSTPVKATDLREMPIEKLVGYLNDWQPSEAFMGDSREGLGRELTVLVTDDPVRFARQSAAFRGCHPTYVRSLLNGFRAAVGKGSQFDWAPVLEFCVWVLQQRDADVPKETGRTRYWAEEDKDWSWSRNSIAYLIETALSGDKGKILFDLRPQVAKIVSALCRDSDPTPTREARSLENNTPPSEISINTTRGVAMNALVHYCLWVRMHLSGGGAKVGLAEVPEAREIFEERLKIDVEPALAIRSIYGRWFPWLHLLDPSWAASHSEEIFPSDPETVTYWEAAWGSYVGFNHAYDNVFEVLKPQYKFAVDRLGQPTKIQARGVRLDEGLASHLMGMYWRDKLQLTEALLVEFFTRSSVKTRAYALEVLGRWLTQMKQKGEEPAAGSLDRLVKLWEQRLEQGEKAQDKNQFAKEMASFGWWFRSETFDDVWSLKQLDRALAVAERDAEALQRISHAILDRLAELSSKFPVEAMSCLERLGSSKASAWQIFPHDKPIRAILSNAIQSGGAAREAAISLINSLGKGGNFVYRDLLPR